MTWDYFSTWKTGVYFEVDFCKKFFILNYVMNLQL